ncbi:MAG TPA: hypothetical protein ENI23_01295 [bacterium]|nr:hypothetical protein [bacterium]
MTEFNPIELAGKPGLEYMRSVFLGYSSHRILDQAIPTFFDGLMPSQKKHILSMQDIKATPGNKYQKSTRVVAQQTGNYHPVGSTYGVLVNMSQDFKNQVMLTDPDGNWGPIESHIPAADRYTEIRLSKFAMDVLLADLPATRTPATSIPHSVVPTHLTYNDELWEEEYLPARLPLLLINGSNGIAIGIAQTFQPLAYRPLLRELIRFIEEKRIDYGNLYLGFPTDPLIVSPRADFIQAMQTGHGSVKAAGRFEYLYTRNKLTSVRVTSVPYTVKLNDVGDKFNIWQRTDSTCPFSVHRNETDFESISLIFEFRKSTLPQDEAEADRYVQQLYSETGLIQSHTINMIALRGKYPVDYTLPLFFEHWVAERSAIIQRVAEKKAAELQVQLHRLDLIQFVKEYLDHIVEELKEAKDEKLLTEFFSNLWHDWCMGAQGISDLTLADTKIILEINLRQISKLSEEEVTKRIHVIQKEWERQIELVEDEFKRTNVIIVDANLFLDRADDYGIPKVTNEFSESAIAQFATTSAPSNGNGIGSPRASADMSFQQFFQPAEDLDILAVTEHSFIHRISNRSVRSMEYALKLATQEDSVIFTSYVNTEYLAFITSEGKFIFVRREDLPMGTPMHMSKVLTLGRSRVTPKSLRPVIILDRNPTHVLLICEGDLVKKIDLGLFPSYRTSVGLPSDIKFGAFVKDDLQTVQQSSLVTNIDLGQVLEVSVKRRRGVQRVTGIGMPSLNAKNIRLIISESGKGIQKLVS